MTNLERCHLSEESDCLGEWGMKVIRSEPVAKTMRVIHTTSGADMGEAKLSAAMLRGRREVLVSRTTGQIYDAKTLRCLTGPLMLQEVA